MITVLVSLLSLIMVSSACCTKCSLSVSNALVASSSNNIFGLLIIARAIATLCFCPPDNRMPRSPTNVSYCSGNDMMKSCALAFFAASIICTSVIDCSSCSHKPNVILSRIDLANKIGSCDTYPILRCNHRRSNCFKSMPSMHISPCTAS
mmetsp:Transcript_57515/g.91473  ORF Transcript_57515/g.91473 Transcript_57515/m.91473 type:complete len:150 (-) Transcript_57515:149-598(-)